MFHCGDGVFRVQCSVCFLPQRFASSPKTTTISSSEQCTFFECLPWRQMAIRILFMAFLQLFFVSFALLLWKPRFLEWITNNSVLTKFSCLSCGSLHLLQSGHVALGCFYCWCSPLRRTTTSRQVCNCALLLPFTDVELNSTFWDLYILKYWFQTTKMTSICN